MYEPQARVTPMSPTTALLCSTLPTLRGGIHASRERASFGLGTLQNVMNKKQKAFLRIQLHHRVVFEKRRLRREKGLGFLGCSTGRSNLVQTGWRRENSQGLKT